MPRLRNRLAREDGFALPIVTAILALVLALGAVAVGRALVATDYANRDIDDRKALQAAEAGLEVAQYRMNALALDLKSLLNLNEGLLQTQCVLETNGVLGIQQLNVGQWCAASSAESLGNGASFSYEISPVVVLANSESSQPGLIRGLLGLLLYNVRNIDRTLGRQVVATGEAGPDCQLNPALTDGRRCIKRRLYVAHSVAGESNLPVPAITGLLGSLLNSVLSGLLNPNNHEADQSFGVYEAVPGSFRECSVKPTTSVPSSGC